MQVIRVSGTIKNVEEEAINRAKAAILQAKRQFGGENGLMKIIGHSDDDMSNIHTRRKMTAASDVSDEDEVDMEMDEDDRFRESTFHA